jgi:hypothetical protein
VRGLLECRVSRERQRERKTKRTVAGNGAQELQKYVQVCGNVR